MSKRVFHFSGRAIGYIALVIGGLLMAFPLMVLSLLISTVYVYLRYL